MDPKSYLLSFAGQEREIHIPKKNLSAEITFTDFLALPNLSASQRRMELFWEGQSGRCGT